MSGVPRIANEALDFHARALRFAESQRGRQYHRFFSTYEGNNAKFFEQTRLLGERFSEHLYRALGHAEVFAVADTMLDTINACAEHVAGGVVHFDMAPCERGFMWTPVTTELVDIHGRNFAIAGTRIGILWTPPAAGSRGICDFYLFTRQVDSPVESQRFAGSTDIPWETPTLFAALHLPADMRAAYNRELASREAQQSTTMRAALGVSYRLAVFLATSWRVMTQPKYVERAGRPPLSLRLKYKRRTPPPVVVVHLRREIEAGDATESGHGTREYSHRFPVREHIRRQRVGPGRREIKEVRVRAHVKGPKDKPLIEKERVMVLDR